MPFLLLELCLNATYLQFQQLHYQQPRNSDGITCILQSLMRIWWWKMWKRALSSFTSTSSLSWKRYVDDTCTAIHPNRIDEFHQHLNSIEPSIQFTCEVEENNQLPFLDVLMKREEDGSISTSVCPEANSSHHPLSHTLSVIRTLFSRADVLSSDALWKTLKDLERLTHHRCSDRERLPEKLGPKDLWRRVE